MTDAATSPASEDIARLLETVSRRYCWDSTPDRATLEAPRVMLRTMNVGTWEDILELERTAGHPLLENVLLRSPAGALTPRAWSFWHYRLGLADVDRPRLPRRRHRRGSCRDAVRHPPRRTGGAAALSRASAADRLCALWRGLAA